MSVHLIGIHQSPGLMYLYMCIKIILCGGMVAMDDETVTAQYIVDSLFPEIFE